MATKRGQKPGPTAPASNGKAPANAWARPLKTTGPPPGMGPADKALAPSSGNKPAIGKKSPNGGNVTSNIHRERLLHLSLTLIGQKVVASLKDGTVLEGVFHTFTPFDGVEEEMRNKYVLTAVKVTKSGSETKIENGSTAILAVEKVISLYGKNINLDRPNQNGGARNAKGEFVTDTQISAAKSAGGTELVSAGSAWTSGGKQARAEALAGALGGAGPTKDTSGLKGSIGKWDQFKANEELFNVNASFDENLYTTELDKSQIDARKIAHAERIAREIENTTSSNIHIAEERGHAVETDYDEEDRYSGVLTKDGKQRHEAAEKAKLAPKMNYAAAAAKADAAKSAAAESKIPEAVGKTAAPTEASKEKKGEKEAQKDKDVAAGPAPKTEEKKEDKDNEKEEKKDAKKSSKLNANAKSFTFNPSAKSFTPSFAAPQSQPQMDPNMQVHGGHPMQPPVYMHGQMGQPGMMPMMNPQYAEMRYPPQYPGMEQQGGPQMQAQAASNPAATGSASSAPATATPQPTGQSPPSGGDGEPSAAASQEGESSQPVAGAQGPQSQQPPQQMPVPYNMPPGAYFAGGGMPMHPRGPGGYPPQFVGGPQQMPVPQGAPYGRQMYPMQPGGMPPNMMRGPNGAPFYMSPSGPMPYPPNAYGHNMMDDDGGYRGGRGGRGQGRGRGRGRGRGGGRGRGNNNNYQQQQYSGRSTPQQQGGPQDPGTAPPPPEQSQQTPQD